MINLYQLLNLPPNASKTQIHAALQNYQNTPNADIKIIRAINEWLLVDDVRVRYNARLKKEFPAFFQAAETQKIPQNQQQEYDDEYETQEYTEETEEYTPVLWNPIVAAVVGLIFNPAFGAWVYALNWQTLGEKKKAQKNLQFAWGVIALYILSILITIFSGYELPLYVGVLIWVGWFFTMGKLHVDFVREHIGDDYERQKWQKPIGLLLLALLAYFVLAVILVYLALLIGVAHPSLFPE